MTIRVRAIARRDLEDPVVGVLIRNRLGIDVFGTNTRIEGVDLGSIPAGEMFEVEFTFDCLLTRQDYTLTVATQYREGFSQDWLDDVHLVFRDGRARCGGLGEFQNESELAPDSSTTNDLRGCSRHRGRGSVRRHHRENAIGVRTEQRFSGRGAQAALARAGVHAAQFLDRRGEPAGRRRERVSRTDSSRCGSRRADGAGCW